MKIRFLNLLVVLSLSAVAVLTLRQAALTLGVLNTSASAASDSSLRARAADAARWEALGEYYTARQAEIDQRARAADAARWEAIGKYYAARQGQAADLAHDAGAAQP